MSEDIQEQTYDTVADISSANLAGNTKSKYPTELTFTLPLVITAILILLPSLWLTNFADDNSERLYQILWGNWISPFILWFFAATAIYLFLKKRKLTQEMHTSYLMTTQVIPLVLEETANEVPPIELFRRFKDGLIQIFPKANVWNLLLSRCRMLLAHDAKSLTDVNRINIDEDAGLFEREYMRGSYALPRFMVWAIPIMGFIGTVWGISNGIAYFSEAMNVDSVADVSSTLKDSLPLVTNSLAAAFDTTFLALLLSVPLMLMMTWFEKAEENYLITLDELWLYEIKPKLSTKFGSPTAITSPAVLPATTEPQPIGEELRLLTAQVSALQQTMEDLYETVFASSLKTNRLE